MNDEHARKLATWMCDVLDNIEDENVINQIRDQVLKLCKQYPVYSNPCSR